MKRRYARKRIDGIRLRNELMNTEHAMVNSKADASDAQRLGADKISMYKSWVHSGARRMVNVVP